MCKANIASSVKTIMPHRIDSQGGRDKLEKTPMHVNIRIQCGLNQVYSRGSFAFI